MMHQVIIIVSMFLIYFHISGLATTNILRLIKGNTSPVLTSKCFCDNCGMAIPPYLQLPIISYVICKGKCKSCGIQIPVFPLLLESTILFGMFAITVLLRCTFAAVSISFLFYEIVRIVTVLVKGKRDNQFGKQYVIAVLAMIPFYVLTLFVALLYRIT